MKNTENVLNIKEYLADISENYIPVKRNLVQMVVLFLKSIIWCKYGWWFHNYTPLEKYWKIEGYFTGNLRETKICSKCSKIVDVLTTNSN